MNHDKLELLKKFAVYVGGLDIWRENNKVQGYLTQPNASLVS